MQHNILRATDERVGFVELFFDLVFVYAITQISHLLLHHYSLAAAAETLFLMLAVWWVWVYTTWVTNRLDPDRTAVRLLMFGLMTAGLFLSMSVPKAFEERGLAFALAYIVMQLGRTLFVGWSAAAAGQVRMARTYRHMVVWFLASAPFWVAGGLAHHEMRALL